MRMISNLTHNPLYRIAINKAVKLYSNKLFLDNDTIIVFTCGAASNDNTSGREKLLSYAEKYFPYGHFFKAEDAFEVVTKSTNNKQRKDLLSIEEKLADYSDCIVLINESPGTLAELGAFASNSKISKKLLVINPVEFENVNSFISLGPIAKTNKISDFKKTINVDFSSISLCFDQVLTRIKLQTVRKHRLSIDFADPENWKQCNSKHKLLFIHDIINLLSPVTRPELEYILKSIFSLSSINISLEISLLNATKRVALRENTITQNTHNYKHNYSTDINIWLGLRNDFLKLYKKINPHRFYLMN